MRKVAFYTLGCKVNQVETEQIKEDFINRGYTIVDFEEPADIYIINTCTVTHVSDRKSRAIIRRAVKKNPRAIVAAIGCMAEANAKQLANIEGVQAIIGNKEKENTAEIVERLAACGQREPEVITGDICPQDKLKSVMYSQQHERTRAFVKIQDGCRSFCSYCIVPYVRGPVRSKMPEDVVAEVKQLLSLGYKEVVLTGIHTGLYGLDLDKWDLVRLLRLILDQVRGDYRIRLSSIEPLEVKKELIDMVLAEQRLCRHFHIPLQSGSDRILKAMGRNYSRGYYRLLIERIGDKIKGVAFTTDVMVGFPGERDEDFEDTYNLLSDLPVSDMHVFKYSRRPGTKAASLFPEVEDKKKKQRSAELLKLAKKKRQLFLKNCLGQELTLLVEKRLNGNKYTGLTDNYIEVVFSSSCDLRGEFVHVRLTDIKGDDVVSGMVIK